MKFIFVLLEVSCRGRKRQGIGCKIGKRSVKTNISFLNLHHTFWGQKEIETDICPGETFNDSCTSVDKTMYVCLFGVFYTLGRNYTVYKRKPNDTKSRYKTIFSFKKFKESHLKNDPTTW